MAKSRGQVEGAKVKPMVTPKFSQLVFKNYKPVPKFRSGCLNCD